MSERKSKFRRELAWPIALALTITWCSGFPASVPEARWLEWDKLGHFAAYGALATAIVRNRGLTRWPVLGLWWALVLASAYGAADEFRQSLTQGIRSPDWHDWLADTIGAVVAVTLYLRWSWYRRLMETPIRRKSPRAQVLDSETGMATKGTKTEAPDTV